jgi:hypothetical protein
MRNDPRLGHDTWNSLIPRAGRPAETGSYPKYSDMRNNGAAAGGRYRSGRTAGWWVGLGDSASRNQSLLLPDDGNTFDRDEHPADGFLSETT